MKYVAALLLARMRVEQPTEADVRAVLASVDCAIDDVALSTFMSTVEGQDISQLMTAGELLLAVPTEKTETEEDPVKKVQDRDCECDCDCGLDDFTFNLFE